MNVIKMVDRPNNNGGGQVPGSSKGGDSNGGSNRKRRPFRPRNPFKPRVSLFKGETADVYGYTFQTLTE